MVGAFQQCATPLSFITSRNTCGNGCTCASLITSILPGHMQEGGGDEDAEMREIRKSPFRSGLHHTQHQRIYMCVHTGKCLCVDLIQLRKHFYVCSPL